MYTRKWTKTLDLLNLNAVQVVGFHPYQKSADYEYKKESDMYQRNKIYSIDKCVIAKRKWLKSKPLYNQPDFTPKCYPELTMFPFLKCYDDWPKEAKKLLGLKTK